MKETIELNTIMGKIQCNYSVPESINGYERINSSLNKMRNLLEATYPRKQLSDIQYELYTYDSEEINAFSCKIEEEYVIAFSIAMFNQSYMLLNKLFKMEKVCKWFETVPIESEYSLNAVYDYMIWFIAFHEFFHMINGHCEYLSARNIFNVEKSIERDLNNNLLGQILESDADYSAVIACVNFIFIQARNKGAFDNSVEENKRNLLLKAAEGEIVYLGFAIYHTFLLFSSEEKGRTLECVNALLKYDHPYSSIRMAYAFAAITYQVGYFLSRKEVINLVNKIDEICIAYDRIYYAKGSFDKSLLSLAFTEKGVQHIMRLHNSWNDVVDELRKYSYIKLQKKETINKMNYWVNSDGTMMM